MRELLASPLLVARRARSAGGAGGRRLRVAAGDGGYELVVEDHGRAPRRRYADAAAIVHAFNAELRRAARDGLTSRPEPAALSIAALQAAERASGGR